MTENIFSNIIHQIIYDKTYLILDLHVPTCVESLPPPFRRVTKKWPCKTPVHGSLAKPLVYMCIY